MEFGVGWWGKNISRGPRYRSSVARAFSCRWNNAATSQFMVGGAFQITTPWRRLKASRIEPAPSPPVQRASFNMTRRGPIEMAMTAETHSELDQRIDRTSRAAREIIKMEAAARAERTRRLKDLREAKQATEPKPVKKT
ncbi:MAG: hypothetical protein E5W59_01695 [Mesorhizobium sp.]|nr:MAG: hypothetical protein E5W59_01695 [Mesorhizobium sp.]